MEKLICPNCQHRFCLDCIDLLDAAPYRRCCFCNKASEDRDWRSHEETIFRGNVLLSMQKGGH